MNLRSILFSLFMLMATIVAGGNAGNVGDALLKKATSITDSDPEQAISLLKKLYEIGVESNNDEMCAQALNLYAWCMFQKGDSELSLSLYYNALNYCSQKNAMLLAEIKTGIGVIDGQYGRIRSAEDNLFEALLIAKQHKAIKMIACIYTNLGSLYAANNDKIRGAYYYKTALLYAFHLTNRNFISRVLSNLGAIEPTWEKQLAYFSKALKIDLEINDLYSASSCYLNIGECYYNKRCFKKALDMLDKSIDLATNIDAKDIIINVFNLRIKIYSVQNNYKMAYYYSSLKSQLKERINNKQRMEAIDNTITSRQMLKLREQNELQKKETEIYRSRIYALGTTVILVLIASLISYRFLLYSKHKKSELMLQQCELEVAQRKVMQLEMEKKEKLLNKANSDLKETREQLDCMQLFFESRNDLLDKIREKLRDNYKLSGEEHITHLKTVNNFISHFYTKDEQNGNGTLTQKNDFVMRLKECYPNLTEGESKLAVYIRAGLSIKRIALLTGMQPASVENKRHRLRKSLNLAVEENLFDFLEHL